jgi:hypothetical protein
MKHIHTFDSFVNENLNEMVKSFALSKKENDFSDDNTEIKKAAEKFLDHLQNERYNTSTMSFMYFPNFIWAGGKQVFGPSIGILIGSDTVAVRPIGNPKFYQVGDSILHRLIKDGQIESYAMKF